MRQALRLLEVPALRGSRAPDEPQSLTGEALGEPVPSDRFPNRRDLYQAAYAAQLDAFRAGPITFKLGAEVVLGHGMVGRRSFASWSQHDHRR